MGVGVAILKFVVVQSNSDATRRSESSLRKCCRSGRRVETVMVGQFSEHDVKKFNDAKTAVSSRLGCNFLFGAEVLRRIPPCSLS